MLKSCKHVKIHSSLALKEKYEKNLIQISIAEIEYSNYLF